MKNYLGPALHASGVGKDIALMILDDQRDLLPQWTDEVSRFSNSNSRFWEPEDHFWRLELYLTEILYVKLYVSSKCTLKSKRGFSRVLVSPHYYVFYANFIKRHTLWNQHVPCVHTFGRLSARSSVLCSHESIRAKFGKIVPRIRGSFSFNFILNYTLLAWFIRYIDFIAALFAVRFLYCLSIFLLIKYLQASLWKITCCNRSFLIQW